MSSVTHPTHYNSGKIEVIEAIEDWKLNFHKGNTVKYTARAGKKDPAKEIEDLEKAAWYLQREIENLKARKEGRAPTRPNDMNPRPSTSATDALSSVKVECLTDTVPSVLVIPGEWREVEMEDGEQVLAFLPLDQNAQEGVRRFFAAGDFRTLEYRT